MVPPLDSNRGVLHASPALSALSPPHLPRCLTSIRFKNVRKGWKSLDIRKMHRSNKHTIPFCWSRSPYDGCGKSILAGGGEGQANQNQPVRATELTKGEEQPTRRDLDSGARQTPCTKPPSKTEISGEWIDLGLRLTAPRPASGGIEFIRSSSSVGLHPCVR